MHTGLFLLYRCHVCTCADLLCPSVCAFLAFHALYGNRQSFHPRIQWACCRYDFRRSALLRDAKSALRIGALLYDRSGRAIECTGKGCKVINIYFFIFLYSINLRFYHQPERFTQDVVEGIPVSEMLNRSFYEVFENGDKKWLVTYADVALNGNKHILQDYSPEIDKTLTIYCFQPASGYCACVLIPS